MSVDMDEWYQGRWATGSKFSKWPDTQTFFREYYKSGKPIGEIVHLTDKILKLFSENNIKATFFFTGETASYYPELCKKISSSGQEIASHNYIHKDYNENNKDGFFKDLKKSKELLEQISGQEILGYRAPNSVIKNYMIKNLLTLGFKYDSSVTPTRPLMGKFGKFTNAPINPYRLSENDFATPGESDLWEFPWSVFPLGKLPSSSGITTRIAGYYYTVISLEHALKTGDTVYYFHPYEIGDSPKIERLSFRTKLLLINLGENYFKTLQKLIKKYRGRFVSGKQLLEEYNHQ